jgi:hypothetical protein
MNAEQLLPALSDLAALVREVREGLHWWWVAGGVLAGVVGLLALQSILGRRCDRCGR